jgi:hypothetical protein
MVYLKKAVFVICCLFLPGVALSQGDLGNPNVCIVIVEFDCLDLGDVPCKGANHCDMTVGGHGVCRLTHEIESLPGTYGEWYFDATGYSSVASLGQTSCYQARRCRTTCIKPSWWGPWVCDWNLGSQWYDAQILFPELQGGGVCP